MKILRDPSLYSGVLLLVFWLLLLWAAKASVRRALAATGVIVVTLILFALYEN